MRRPPLTDSVLAVALGAYAQIEIWYPNAAVGVSNVTGSRAVLVPTALLMTLPLALRRRFPLLAAVAILVASAVQSVLTTPTEGLAGIVASLLALYSVGAYADSTRAAIAAATGFAAVAAAANGAGDLAFGVLIFGGALLFGVAMRRRHLHAAELTRERDEAVTNERARLARELHDVVAHSVSTIVVQAQAGNALFDREPARAREAFHAIEESGRQALVELRRLLGLLRDAGPVDSDTSPQPGLGELDALVDGFRRAGLKATLRIDGPPPALPPGIDLAAYRVVQEALTNALKHADGAAVAVRVRCAEDTLELEVLDDGQNPARAAVNGHGQGLVGMRERLSLYGGELEVGPGRDRGFVVRARFPLAQ